MPGPDELVPGAPAWVELTTTDVAAASDFYVTLFGWEVEDTVNEYGGYRLFTLGGKRVAGVGPTIEGDPAPPRWTVYLLTFNAATTGGLVGEAGGTVLFEPMAVPEMGVMGMAIDATGAVVGYWQPGVMEGFDAFGELGTAAWFELAASDFDAAERFYAHAFDWAVMRGDEEPRTAVYRHGERSFAGIVDAAGILGPDVPSSWRVAFGVADVDDAVERAVAAGGSLALPARDLPSGRSAALLDPTGAPFMVASRAAG